MEVISFETCVRVFVHSSKFKKSEKSVVLLVVRIVGLLAQYL